MPSLLEFLESVPADTSDQVLPTLYYVRGARVQVVRGLLLRDGDTRAHALQDSRVMGRPLAVECGDRSVSHVMLQVVSETWTRLARSILHEVNKKCFIR